MNPSLLRKKYPRFIYKAFSYKIFKGDLVITFDFRIPPDFKFLPKLTIKNVDKNRFKKIKKEDLENLVFHLGLIETLSYWKATCSPEIVIKAGYLTKSQIQWWKDLIFRGMGQFFYENKIDFLKPDFIKIIAKSKIYKKQAIAENLSFLENGILIPVGGGKDSVVTLELFKKVRAGIKCFSLNPSEATLKIMRTALCREPIIVKRIIDPKLLELNRQGFLNGHTPFSAYLAFLSVLVAAIFGQKYIAFSNERSSNEGNVKYLGKIINHQWSKSFEFEEKFRKYQKKYLTAEVDYFSFLRPLYDIQIAKLFSNYPKYFSAFLSCNEAYKTYSGRREPIKKWCGECPKCLFVFATLYPFLEEKKLLKIFGKNIFENKKLLPVMQELIGKKKFKPFECVGTTKESMVAFYLSWKKIKKEKKRPPFLIDWFEKKVLPTERNLEKKSKEVMSAFDKNHSYVFFAKD